MSSNSISESFEKYRHQLLSFIRNRTSDDEAEDTLQDVFLRLVEADRISPITQVANWLYQAARNKIIDNSRKKREERMPEIASKQDNGDTLGRAGGCPRRLTRRTALCLRANRV